MLQINDELLKQDYDITTKEKPEALFMKAIGLKINNLDKLSEEIFSDLDVNNFGVGWWNFYQQLGTKRRIFISDYLFMSLQSINSNLIDARIHLLEFEKNWNLENEFLKTAYEKSGYERIVHKRENPFQDYSRYSSEMHIIGFVRAIGSIFDCLASTIIGVTGLHLNIKHADFGKILNYLKKSKDTFEVQLLTKFESALTSSGPDGWMNWITNLRNMYVHRARRTIMSQLKYEEFPTEILNKKGKPIAKSVKTIRRLAFNPELTDVEAWLDGKISWMLNEEAKFTLDKIMDSTYIFLSEINKYLLTIWVDRRNNPELRIQPRIQWKTINDQKMEFSNFIGYDPSQLDANFKQLMGNRVMGKRMASASVLDHNRENWESFD